MLKHENENNIKKGVIAGTILKTTLVLVLFCLAILLSFTFVNMNERLVKTSWYGTTLAEEEGLIDISNSTITIKPEENIYTGNPIAPRIEVELGGVKLLENQDYTVTYENNTEIGTASVIVTGIGNYGGTITQPFNIVAAKVVIEKGIKYELTKVSDEETDVIKNIAKVVVYEEGIGEKVEIAKKIIYNEESYIVTEIKASAFANCEFLRSVKIPSSVQTIEEGAFNGTVEGFTICGDEGSTAETYAIDKGINFKYNIEKYTVTIEPKENIHTGNEIEPTITVKLGEKTLEKGADYDVTYSDNTGIGEATVKITGEGDYVGEIIETFDIVGNLEQNKIIYKVTKERDSETEEIKRIAKVVGFKEDIGTEVNIPGSVEYDGEEYEVKIIEKNAFSGCSNIESITMSDNITNIGYKAFYNCLNLKSITMSKHVMEIGGSTFEGCSSLEEIIIPNQVKIIKEGTFKNCTNLTKIKIPSGVNSIEDAFEGCSELTIYGSYNTAAYQYAVDEQITFKDMNLINYTITLGENKYIHDGTEKKPAVEVKTRIEEVEIKLAEGDYTVAYKNNIEVGEAIVIVTGTGTGMCEGEITAKFNIVGKATEAGITYELTKVKDEKTDVIRNTAKVVDYEEGVAGEEVEITKEIIYNEEQYIVTEIKANAFRNSRTLKKVSIPDSVETIEGLAFVGCSELTSIKILGRETEIRGNAFLRLGEGLTIYGNEGSVAETYARGKGINFKDIDVTKYTITLSETEYMYDGTAKEPEVEVTKGEGEEIITLEEGTDYEVTYSDNTEVGEATVKVTGKGNCEGETTATFNIVEPAEVPTKLGFSSDEYNIKEKFIRDIKPNTKFSDFKNNISTNATEIEIYDNDEAKTKITNEEDIMKTGMTVRFVKGEETLEYTIVVTGDVTGDGLVLLTDVTKLAKHNLEKLTLEGAYLEAGDLNYDGEVAQINDITILAKVVLGKITL